MSDVSKTSVIAIHAKCSDLCFYELIDDKDQHLTQHNGYVPSWMPGDHYGDYIILEIDRETGMILNWKRPTDEQLTEALED